jgi:DNA modification methylase
LSKTIVDWSDDKDKSIETSVMRECKPFVPTSVLKLPNHREARDLRKPKLEDAREDKEQLTENAPVGLKKKIKSYRKKESNANFDPELAKFILKYFARDAKTVFDPFSGWGERGNAAKLLKYEYIGYDISPIAIDYAIKTYGVTNRLGDSRHTDLPNNSMDFSFSCPPYWNLEEYQSVEGQLTDIKGYQDFLKELEKTVQETNRVLKDGALVCWVVGDFRRDRKLIDFSTDVGLLFRNNGFELKDKVIIDNSTNYNVPIHLPNSYEHKFTVKVHETMWVYKKINNVNREHMGVKRIEPMLKEPKVESIEKEDEWGDWKI